MSEGYQITKNALPLIEDYTALKEDGLAYIQSISEESWTNLNSTDPGVTILEQICFALTELGYCSQFSIEDILADRQNEIDFKNQFYFPEEILTTSPITIKDFVKFLVDELAFIDNIQLEATATLFPQTGSLLHSFVPPLTQDFEDEEEALDAVKFALNKVRNLNQFFPDPKFLTTKSYLLKGHLEIHEDVSHYEILSEINEKVSQFIFPRIVADSYQNLKEQGAGINEILSGPNLRNGWILSSTIEEKRNELSSNEVTHLITSIDGVKSASGISFNKEKEGKQDKKSISCQEDELLVIDVFNSNFNINGSPIKTLLPDLNVISSLLSKKEKGELNAKVSSSTADFEYPSGTFRNINKYYSIQDTMPEVYGVGNSAERLKGTSQQIGRKKQLIAYLTLIDQVIANYFSQLANVPNLFSFKNPTTGNPSGERAFYHLRNQIERKQLEIPVPYKCFSPTYFYQSLYEAVTNIRPVLRNNLAFNFDLNLDSERETMDDSWDEFKDAPYNSYIHGLMEIIEEPEENLSRRNKILNHLLARHGESPKIIDEIIDGTRYSGNDAQDKVVIKSALLRNLNGISYNRFRAYNYLSAHKLSTKFKIGWENTYEGIVESRSRDFIFNSDEFEKKTSFTSQDFIDYSVIELTLNLLFGLETYYHDYIIENNEKAEVDEKFKQLSWLIQERRGCVFVEKSLLYQFAKFQFIYKPSSASKDLFLSEWIDYAERAEFEKLLVDYTGETDQQKIILQGNGKTFSLHISKQDEIDPHWFKEVNGASDQVALKASWGNELTTLENPDQGNTLICILPSYIEAFSEDDFQSRLSCYCDYFLPANTVMEVHSATEDQLRILIECFIAWHNGIRFDEENESDPYENARKLLSIITEIKLIGID